MTMLISLKKASDHLRRDTNADNDDLELKIQAASDCVINYMDADATFLVLDSSGQIEEDSDGVAIDVPPYVQIATLILVGIFYKDRDSARFMQGGEDYGRLPFAVTSVLYPKKKPVFA